MFLVAAIKNMFDKIKSLFKPHIKPNTPLPVYVVYNLAYSDIPLTFVSTRDEAIEVANRYLYANHYPHYKLWCHYHDLDIRAEDSWEQYINTVIASSQSLSDKFEVAQIEYDLDYFTSVLRKLAHCMPLGFDFEYPDEFLSFFNTDMYHPLVAFEPSFHNTLEGFLEAVTDFNFDLTPFKSRAFKLTRIPKSLINFDDETVKRFEDDELITDDQPLDDTTSTLMEPPARTQTYNIKFNGEPILSSDGADYFSILRFILQSWEEPKHSQQSQQPEQYEEQRHKEEVKLEKPASKKRGRKPKIQQQPEPTPVEKEEQVPVEESKPIVPEKAEIPVSKKRGRPRKAQPQPEEAVGEKEAKGSPEGEKETPQPKKRGRKPKNK